MPRNKTPHESVEQELIFKWARSMQVDIPHLVFLNASMNGIRVTPGLRNKMKRQGMVKGFPDINLPIKTKRYNGLYIELKRLRGGAVSPEQKEWLDKLNNEGYLAVVEKGHVKAISRILKYLKQR